MRAFVGGIVHETHRTSPIPTNRASFEEGLLARPRNGERDRRRAGSFFRSMGFEQAAADLDVDLVHGLIAVAQPSAPTVRSDYEAMRTDLLEDLRDALPVDFVMLHLHGAQLAEGYDDCEGDILSRLRDVVGPAVPIGALFDLHGNVTEKMVASGAVLMACKEYPHIDYAERAPELMRILVEAAAGGASPFTVTAPVPVLGLFPTTRAPLKDIVAETAGWEGSDGVQNVSIFHGFTRSDIPEAHQCVVLTGTGDKARLQAKADALAERLFSLREEISVPLDSVDEAFEKAQNSNAIPVVMADQADNPGGGAPCDSTFLLRHVLDNGLTDVAIGMLWDPVAVQFAHATGEGGRVSLRIGGKCGPSSGDPVDLDVEVIAVREGLRQWGNGINHPMGRTAAVEADGVTIVLTDLRNQTFSPTVFTDHGIDLSTKRIVIVKSTQHFHAGFFPLAGQILYVNAPGATSSDFRPELHPHILRPAWPFDSAPFEAFGKRWG